LELAEIEVYGFIDQTIVFEVEDASGTKIHLATLRLEARPRSLMRPGHVRLDDHGTLGMMDCGGLETKVGEGRHQSSDEFAHGGFSLTYGTHRDDIVTRTIEARDHGVEVAAIFCIDVRLHDGLTAGSQIVPSCLHAWLLFGSLSIFYAATWHARK
jgi:hypothetical protein